MAPVLDEQQAEARARLQRLAHDLARPPVTGWRARRPRGVYLWGRPGRGKTWLMDRFLDSLREGGLREVGLGEIRSARVHFHEFLAAPVVPPGIRLLCFDEFHVHDVGDAMFLRRLLGEVRRRRIALVTTSNYPPEGLLPSPLHHHQVLPAVDAIRQDMDVVAVDGPVDYRTHQGEGQLRRSGFASGRFVSPGTSEALAAAGLGCAPRPEESRSLTVHGRRLRALAVRGEQAWFDFHDLCVRPVSATDYLALSERFSSWVVLDVPHFDRTSREAPQRLANLVDVLHDRDLPLHLGCDVGLRDLAGARRQPLDQGRTFSRLHLLREVGRAGEVSA